MKVGILLSSFALLFLLGQTSRPSSGYTTSDEPGRMAFVRMKCISPDHSILAAAMNSNKKRRMDEMVSVKHIVQKKLRRKSRKKPLPFIKV